MAASRRILLLAMALVALTVVVYAGVWSFDFVTFDDPEYIVKNPNIAGGLTWTGVAWAFTTGYAANWHPLTWLSHMLDVQLFGMNAGPAHLVSLLLHIANVLLLFWFLAEVTGAAWRSAVVAALFAVHPLHVESVAWVSERKDVLSTLFWMLTLCAYARYVKKPDWPRYLAVIGLFGLGLLAKPMLVTLPFVLLLLDVWPLGRVAYLREKLPLFVLAAASSVATMLAQHVGGAVVALDVIPLGLRVENALVSYATYLVRMFWPTRLYMYYPHVAGVPVWLAASCAALLAVITTTVILFRRACPYLTVGWLWYVGTLVPVIGLVQVGRQSMADRYTYIPLIGLFVAVVWGAADLLARWPARRWAPALAALFILLPCSLAARTQVEYWRSDTTLWRHALQTATGLDDRRTNMAVDDLLAEGGVVPMQVLLFGQESSGSVFPPFARDFLGQLFARHDQLDEAVQSFSEAIRLAPGNAEFHRHLANVLWRQGKAGAAAPEYADADRLSPSLVQTETDLALTLASQGKLDEALPHFTEAARLRPASADTHRNLALALANLGRVDDAIQEFREVLRLKPDDANVRRVLDEYARRGKAPGGGAES